MSQPASRPPRRGQVQIFISLVHAAHRIELKLRVVAVDKASTNLLQQLACPAVHPPTYRKL
eukprot:scaffold39673_cov17-Prasinocladus_malaysianus.AAC.1